MVGWALAYRAIPLQASYGAAKHAIRGFADALRVELEHEGSAVRVTTVHLPGPPNRPNYLYEPLSGDPGAHGRFNAEATDRSPTWWATKRRARIAPAVLAAAAGGAMAVAPRRR